MLQKQVGWCQKYNSCNNVSPCYSEFCRLVIGWTFSARPPLKGIYKTAVFRGCRSFSNIDMAKVMLNHPQHHCYFNPGDMQDISDEDDEATSRRRHLGAEGDSRQYGRRRQRARYREGTHWSFLLLHVRIARSEWLSMTMVIFGAKDMHAWTATLTSSSEYA